MTHNNIAVIEIFTTLYVNIWKRVTHNKKFRKNWTKTTRALLLVFELGSLDFLLKRLYSTVSKNVLHTSYSDVYNAIV